MSRPPLTPVPCRSRAEPRDGGSLNPHAPKGRYSVFKAVDVAKTIKAERKRLEEEQRARRAAPAAVLPLHPAQRGRP
jgi:hypothetical protein